MKLLNVLFMAVAVCTGCAQVRTPNSAGFGPSQSEPLPFGKGFRGAPARLPGAMLPSRSELATSTLAFSQVRLDSMDSQLQHYEVQLVVVPAGPGRDEGLAAVWMSGREQADRRTLTRALASFSHDGGRSFQQIPLAIGSDPAQIQFDPTLAFDESSQRMLIGLMEQSPTDFGDRRLWLARSPQGLPQSTSSAQQLERAGPGPLDKGWLASGRDATGAAVLYLTDVAGLRVSRDAGASWSAPQPLAHAFNLIQPLLLSDGRLFISYLGLADGARGMQALFVAGENENSLSAPLSAHDFAGSLDELTGSAVPGGFRTAPTPVVAQSPLDGRLYMVIHDVGARAAAPSADADLDLVLRVSEDGGRSWSAARNLSAGLEPFADQFMPWLQVDVRGGLHLVYFEADAAESGDRSTSANVHVWYARSDDQGVHWQRTRLTAQPIPSQRTRWAPFGGIDEAQFVGDYLGLAVGAEAVFAAHPVFDGAGVGIAVSRFDLASAGAPLPANPLALAGLWFEPATSGQGFQIDWIEGDILTVVFFGHRDSGANLFLTGAIAQRPQFGQPLQIPLQQVRGGRFNGLDPALIERSDWGELELRFDDCGSASALLRGIDGEQALQMQRIGRPPGIACP